MSLQPAHYTLPAGSLAATVRQLGLQPNALAVLPRDILDLKATPPGAGAAPVGLDPRAQEQVARIVALLASPAKVARLFYTLGDASVSRTALVWAGEGQIVTVSKRGDQRRLEVMEEIEIRHLVARVLAANSPMTPSPFNLRMSALAVVILLAVIECMQANALYATLQHSAPVTTFTVAEIAARLAEAEREDFRWPLMFVQKIMPARLALNDEELVRGLAELTARGLVERADEAAAIHALTPVGAWLVDGVSHHVSKAALGFSAFREDGQIGHEVLLFVRSPANLFLFDLAGKMGGAAAITAGELDALLEGILQSPAVTAPAPPTRPEPPAQAKVLHREQPAGGFAGGSLRCPQCGVPVKPGQRFCGACGTSLTDVQAKPGPSFCGQCGKQLAPEARFCPACGAPTQ